MMRVLQNVAWLIKLIISWDCCVCKLVGSVHHEVVSLVAYIKSDH